MQTKLSEKLKQRGFINQFSGDSLETILDNGKKTFYLGVDPTAESIHIGNLAVYMMMRHIVEAGHKVILLVGGGTALLGDPKETAERPLSDKKEVARRAKKLRAQISNLLDADIEVVDNAKWLNDLKVIDFMRDIGKHLTVNQMIKKEIIAKRLSEENPISYTEFAYAPLQGYDFLHLFQTHKCEVQVGGSDQWGNMMTGVELIRKIEGKTAYVITTPIILDSATGKKFGKSEGNAIWIDKKMTTPYKFYQFWLNVNDNDVIDRLKIFTMLDLEEINVLSQKMQLQPSERLPQKVLAYEVTKFIHGRESADLAKEVSEILFGKKNFREITKQEIEIIKQEAPTLKVDQKVDMTDSLLKSGLAKSKKEARALIDSGAVSLTEFNNDIAILRKGKRSLCVLLR